MVATESVDIIAITETWISPARDFAAEYHLPGYTMHSRDRQHAAGGGVAVYVRDHLNCVQIPADTHFEVLGVELRGMDAALRLFVVYRPPHTSLADDLDLYRDLTLLVRDKAALLVGDFNGRVDWGNGVAMGGEGARLLDFANDNLLTQMVREPTRGDAILDLILTTDEDLVTGVEVGECLGTSDHNMVFCCVNLRTDAELPDFRRKLDLRRADFERFDLQLRQLPLVEEGAVDEMWESFRRRFTEIQSDCIPLKVVGGSSKRNPKWFGRAIGAAIKRRKRLYREHKMNPTPVSLERLTSERRFVKRLVKRAKVNEERRVATACLANPKEFFAYVNSRKPARTSLGPVVDRRGNLVTDSAGIAEEFNSYFTGVFTRENDNEEMPVPTIVYGGENPLEEIVCTEEMIVKKLQELKDDKSPGPDGFLPKVLRAVSVGLAPHLCRIFNKSLETGQAPDMMKLADVTPIHKKGARDVTGNYRPISLTSVPGKVLESVIKDSLVEHFERHSLLSTSQHGFRAGRSCLTNLLEFYHEMFTTYDRTRAVDIVFLDFQKAFDKVPHRRLMVKVRALGVSGSIARWIESWLSNRRQRVVVTGVSSGWAPVTSGVPQGSVLGPLLFLIYINDLDFDLTSKVSKFADDTKLGVNAADPALVAELQRDLSRIGDWSERWLMPFNSDKCHVLHVGPGNPGSAYSLQGRSVGVVSAQLDLGVLISGDFKFSAQCVAAEKKAHKMLGYIKRQFSYRNRKVVLSLYNALVRPLLEYAVQFWSPTLRRDIERLEKVQARATKLIPSLRNRGYEARLSELSLFSLEKRRLRGQLIETYKLFRGFTRVDPSDLFQICDNPTRGHELKVVPPRFTTAQFRDFMTSKICNVWNRLPARVVCSPSLASFKRRLDRILPELDY